MRTLREQRLSCSKIVHFRRPQDILAHYRNTPILTLLASHNLGVQAKAQSAPDLLVLTCMDPRISLRISANSAFVIRTGGANAEPVDFYLCFAAAVTTIQAMAVITHTRCAMEGLGTKSEAFVTGLVNRDHWRPEHARKFVKSVISKYEIGDPAAFALRQANRLRDRFPHLTVAPLLYSVEDGLLYQIRHSTGRDFHVGADHRQSAVDPQTSQRQGPGHLRGRR